MSSTMFPTLEDARKVALSLTFDRADGEALAERMYEASTRGDNACYLHQAALFYGWHECLCAKCNPGKARGLFRGVAAL